MVTQEKLNELLEELKADVARMRPTPIGMTLAADVFWADDPLPVACSHGNHGRCHQCDSNAFDAAMDYLHEDRGHD
jgi:hypothetical protein